MASETNVKRIIRETKNVPAAGNVERVLREYNYDQGSLYRVSSIVEKISLAAAAQGTLTTSLPAGANVLFAGIVLETGMVLVTGTNLAIGTAGTPSAFYLSGVTMTAGTSDIQPTPNSSGRVAVATPIKLTTTNGAGALTGTGTGTVKVVVVYEYCQAIQA